jgi:hypothetical protein
MKIALYDHRKTRGCGFYQDIGAIKKWFLNKEGDLRIAKTDLLYSLTIHFTKKELEILRQRLNEIHDKKLPKNSVALDFALQAIKSKEVTGDGPETS